jgi:hypothetical protein
MFYISEKLIIIKSLQVIYLQIAKVRLGLNKQYKETNNDGKESNTFN